MTDSSQHLVESAAAGDPAAIDALLEQNLPALRAFIRLRMGPQLRAKESSLDLVQSACREILAHIDRYQYQGESNFRHWLFTTALRKLKNKVVYYQAAKRDVRLELSPDEENEHLNQVYQTVATPSQHLQGKEQRASFEKAFEQLSEDHREVILLARVVGLSHREIASVMKRSESATRNLLYRGLAELASAMRRGSGD